MINADKPNRWNEDTQASILQYNDWFFNYAPSTYQSARDECIEGVQRLLDGTNYLRSLDEQYLWNNPEDLAIARMFCAPPIARERLAGLAQVSKTVVESMEKGNVPRGRSRIKRQEAISRIIPVLRHLTDTQLCAWLKESTHPSDREIEIASCVAGDRLCGSLTDPLIRNEQERRQLSKLDAYLEARGYQRVETPLYKLSICCPARTVITKM